MAEEKKELVSPQGTEMQEIDLIELAQKLWAERRLILKVCGIAVVVALVVAFSIPKEYSTTVTLAPEMNSRAGSSMSTLAAIAGINLSGSKGDDALSPELYPDIVNSTPFLVDLFNVRVRSLDARIDTTLYNYMTEHQRSAWFRVVLSSPFRALGWVASLFKKDKDPEEELVPLSERKGVLSLTSDENGIMNAIKGRINVMVDEKSGVATLTVLMQDPLISATVTDTVMRNLQKYITDYRTNKARHDLAFTEQLYAEAKADYEKAQQAYADFVDSNQNIIRQSAMVEQERLQNEMNLAYQVYTQVAQQLQMAKAKVQEITPVYTVVQPATVPLRAAKPSKMLILIGFVFLAGVGCSCWILFLRDMVKEWRKPSADAAQQA